MEEKAGRKPMRLFAKLFLLLRWVGLLALSLACVAVFYVAVVMGETPAQEQAEGGAPSTPLPSAAPLPGAARNVESADLAQLRALFPAHLATLPARQNFTLVSGTVEDVRAGGAGQVCRVVSLTYSHPALQEAVVVRSAVPGAYIARYARDTFALSRDTVTLGKLQAMTLTAGGTRCYVAVQGEAVYALEGPDAMAGLANVPGWVILDESESSFL